MTGRRPVILPYNDPRHGTVNGYKNLGCRCITCTRANTEYTRQERHHRTNYYAV